LGALVAVNAVGSVTVADTPHFWAAPFEIGGEFGALGYPAPMPRDAGEIRLKLRSGLPQGNTTIAIIATDAVLSPAAAKRLAIAAHDGFARAIWPTHTPADGDLVFSLATARSGMVPAAESAIYLHAAASATMARAIARAVFAATWEAGDLLPVWSSRMVAA